MALLESAGFGIKRCTDKRKGWYMDKRLFQDYELKIMCDSIYGQYQKRRLYSRRLR